MENDNKTPQKVPPTLIRNSHHDRQQFNRLSLQFSAQRDLVVTVALLIPVTRDCDEAPDDNFRNIYHSRDKINIIYFACDFRHQMW
ncbi:hypothetical protein CEXT_479631 [Caerostris extrusa]|uniref:Uncharacterized protein n=1 Tax=Caerostris extrusa TaxID=172846 RepID=A0AAV4P116_CAEEX|nr:hypothetical protein CEXT_479631 [Caerostris extrusa]